MYICISVIGFFSNVYFPPTTDSILQVNPEERPSVDDILFELQSVAEARGIDLTSPVLVSITIILHQIDNTQFHHNFFVYLLFYLVGQ